MNRHDSDDLLDQWADVWQTQDDPLTGLREDFERATRRETLIYHGSMAMLAGSMAFVAWSVVKVILAGRIVFGICAALYLPMAVYLMQRTRDFYNQRLLTLPLSPSGYVEAMRHNLEVKHREVLWSGRFLPVGMGFTLVLVLLALLNDGPTLVNVSKCVFLAATFATGAYHVYVYEPQKLEERARDLDRLAHDLGVGQRESPYRPKEEE